MKRKFITSLGFLIILNVLIKPFYVFGIDRVVQNMVGTEVYGSFFSLFSSAIIFQILLDLGIENFVRREIARHPKQVNHYLSNIVFLKLLLAIPYILVCFGVALSMGITKQEIPILFLVLLNQFFASFILYIRANLGGLQLFKTEGVVSVLDRSLMILIVGFLILHPATAGKFEIVWFVLAQSISYFVVILISLSLIRKRTGPIQIQFNIKELIPIIKKLIPYATLVLLMGAYFRGDSIMLRILLPEGKQQAGIFAHSFRILDFLSNYALLFPVLLLPIFSKLLKEKKPIGELLQLSWVLLIVPSLAAIVPTVIYRNEIFDILYPGYSSNSSDVYAILTISFIGMCISYTFGALLTANGNLKELNIMALFALLISIFLNIILIPRYEIIGAAVANASAQLFSIMAHIALVRFKLKIGIRLGLVVKMLFYLTFIIGMSILLYIEDLPVVPGMLITIVSGILMAFTIRIFHIQDVIALVKEKIAE